MSVRAKMKCYEIATREGYTPPGTPPAVNEVVKLTAVAGEENKPWSTYTPSGSVELTITNPDAVKQFEVGKQYFVDFSPAD